MTTKLDNFKAYLRGKHEGWGFDNFKPYHLRGFGNMDKVDHLSFDNFKAYYLRGKHAQSGPLEGSAILRRTICEGSGRLEGSISSMKHAQSGPHEGSTILRPHLSGPLEGLTPTICDWKHGESGPLEVSIIFKAYHLRGKHGQSGPFLEGSTILRRTICEGHMHKVRPLEGLRQF